MVDIVSTDSAPLRDSSIFRLAIIRTSSRSNTRPCPPLTSISLCTPVKQRNHAPRRSNSRRRAAQWMSTNDINARADASHTHHSSAASASGPTDPQSSRLPAATLAVHHQFRESLPLRFCCVDQSHRYALSKIYPASLGVLAVPVPHKPCTGVASSNATTNTIL